MGWRALVWCLALRANAHASLTLDGLLATLKLEVHRDTLVKLGYEDVADYANFEEGDIADFKKALQDASVPPGHVGKLMRAVASSRARTPDFTSAEALERVTPSTPTARRRRLSESGGSGGGFCAPSSRLRLRGSSSEAVIAAGDESLIVAVAPEMEEPRLTLFSAGNNLLDGATTVRGDVTINGTTRIGGAASITGSATIDGSLRVGAVDIQGTDGVLTTPAGASFGGALSSSGGFSTTGDASINGDLVTTGSASLGGPLSISGGLSTTGDASIGGDLSTSGSMSIGGDLSWNQGVYEHTGSPIFKEVSVHYPCCTNNMNDDWWIDFAIGGSHFWVEVEALAWHGGGATTGAYIKRLYATNAYTALTPLTDRNSDDDSHFASGVGGQGTWSISRPKTGHNSHDWVSNTLRVKHEGGSGPYGNAWYIRVKSNQQNLRIRPYNGATGNSTCSYDCAACATVPKTAGDPSTACDCVSTGC